MSAASRPCRADRPGWSGQSRPPPGRCGCQTGRVRTRALVCAAALLNSAAVAVSVWLTVRPDGAHLAELPGAVTSDEALVGLAWAMTGAVLAWLRPGNPLGWLMVIAGTCASFSASLSEYGAAGVLVAVPPWPLARWAAWLGSALWLPGLLPLANLLPALYPHGQLPGPRWRWPVAAAAGGIVLLTVAALLDPGFYDEVVPGHSSPVAAPGLAPVLYVLAAATLAPSTLAIWVMSLVRLARSRPPERPQLAWLLVVVLPLFVLVVVPGVPEWVWDAALYLIPIAIGIGVFRHNLLGIEVVLRRGLLYAILTGVVVTVYLAVTVVAGSRLDRDPLPGVVAAALVAVGLTPLRERLQRAVDRLVYGERRDPLSAVTRLGDRVAADEPDLLSAMLRIVTTAVRAPGATVTDPDGLLVASYGRPATGPTFTLRVGGLDVGALTVSARTPGESYTAGDHRLLGALVPQVAVVVRAIELAEALEAERDRVVAATRTERDRLRHDLHDGLGPSLSGIRLGLLAMHDALTAGDNTAGAVLLDRIRTEVDTTVGEVRRIIDGFRPAVLDDTGLVGALRRHAAWSSAGVHVDLAVPDLPQLPPQVETAAYRIAQEALTNVIRHAAARNALITLAIADGALTVQVADDGSGLDSTARDGVGLASMRQRAEALGGTLALASTSHGTTVLATLPLRDPRT
jgi:signal transduction histidine kinase